MTPSFRMDLRKRKNDRKGEVNPRFFAFGLVEG